MICNPSARSALVVVFLPSSLTTHDYHHATVALAVSGTCIRSVIHSKSCTQRAEVVLSKGSSRKMARVNNNTGNTPQCWAVRGSFQTRISVPASWTNGRETISDEGEIREINGVICFYLLAPSIKRSVFVWICF